MEITNDLSDKGRNDLQLVYRAKQGDEKAFAGLMNRYRDSIYYMLIKMVNNASDAEDLTIEAFTKAFSNIEAYTPKYAFSTWLFRIATNNCFDFIRKERVSPSPLYHLQEISDDATVNIHSDLPNPEESMITFQKINELKEVVSQLNPMYRKPIELRYYREYSYEEISKALNMPVGTVKARLNRAKLLLHNILAKTGNK